MIKADETPAKQNRQRLYLEVARRTEILLGFAAYQTQTRFLVEDAEGY